MKCVWRDRILYKTPFTNVIIWLGLKQQAGKEMLRRHLGGVGWQGESETSGSQEPVTNGAKQKKNPMRH